MPAEICLTVNGRPVTFAGVATLADLIAQLELPARGFAVELNDQVVPRERHPSQNLASGDRLEIVSLVGGG